jgi:hypothetical protein
MAVQQKRYFPSPVIQMKAHAITATRLLWRPDYHPNNLVPA